MKIINRTVWILSFISLFADIASEMLYPVIPVYLKEIGFTVFWIGILEGIANFTAGLSRGYFGKLSDEKGVRLPFIKWGYFLSAVSKPMMAAFTYPVWIFFARVCDRLGKGLRTAARDALLSQNATPQTKARVFGFHRGMDTLGAAIGPVVALLLLYFYPGEYVLIFLIAFLPGLISVALVFIIKEKREPVSTLGKGNFFSFFKYWKIASPQFKRLMVGLLFFDLFNSSDLFLILKTSEAGGNDTYTIGAYILYNVVFALASYPLGMLADRLGIKKIFFYGLFLYVITYMLFGLSSSITTLFIAFFLYGLYAAATEGISKAWITNMAHNTNTATAIGFYASCQSISALLASAIAGLIWTFFGSEYTFFMSATAGLLTMLYFLFYMRPHSKPHKEI